MHLATWMRERKTVERAKITKLLRDVIAGTHTSSGGALQKMSVRNVHPGGQSFPTTRLGWPMVLKAPSSTWPTYECHVRVTEAREEKEKAGCVMQPGHGR